MQKYILSYAISALLILIPVSMVCFDSQWNAALEQRERKSLPEFPKKIQGNTVKKYLVEMDRYIADTIPFRTKLIAFAWKFFEDAGFNDDINIVVRGKGNWLFIGNNFEDTVDKLQGKFTLQGSALSEVAIKYTQIYRFAEDRGADFALLIGPNKSSVYPEYLPPIIYPAKTRYITPGVEALRRKGILVVDPTDLLKNSKDKGLSYYRTDTHWNLLGGSIAASALLEQLKLPVPRNYKLVPGPFFSGGNIGLAGYTNFPLTEGDNYNLEWEPPFTITISKDGESNEASGSTPIYSIPEKCIIASNKNAATDKIAWIYTDSFGTALSPFFNATFKEVYYLHLRNFWRGYATPDIPSPDFVITIMVERSF